MHEIEQLYKDHASDPRPLPLIVAALWKFPLQRDESASYFAIQDWIAGLTGATLRKASEMWRQMDANELRISITQLPYEASNGKTYQLDHTDDKGLYAIAAHLRATADRPALAQIKQYLAMAGAFTDELRRAPERGLDAAEQLYRRRGKDDAWIQARVEGRFARQHFTAALGAALGNPQGIHYALATNDVYVGLWKRTAAQLKDALGLSKSQALRDYQPALALAYQRMAEMVIAEKLGSATDLTWPEAEAIIKALAGMIGRHARETGEALGTDLATGKKLLK